MGYQHSLIFYILTILAMAAFAVGVTGHVLFVRQGGRPMRKSDLDTTVVRRALLKRVLLQLQLLQRSPFRWAVHMAIFWSFIMLFLESLWLMVLAWVISEGGAVGLFFSGYSGQALLNLWGDAWGVVLLAAVCVALVRRYIVRAKQLLTLLEDAVALWFLLAVVLSGFAAEGTSLSLGGRLAPGWAFAGRAFEWVGPAFGLHDAMTLFWFHGAISLAFIAYIPFGKLVHMLVAPIEIPVNASLYQARGEQL